MVPLKPPIGGSGADVAAAPTIAKEVDDGAEVIGALFAAPLHATRAANPKNDRAVSNVRRIARIAPLLRGRSVLLQTILLFAYKARH